MDGLAVDVVQATITTGIAMRREYLRTVTERWRIAFIEFVRAVRTVVGKCLLLSESSLGWRPYALQSLIM